MKVFEVTNENYIPLTDLEVLGSAFSNQVNDYRQQFNEVIILEQNGVATIVETPALIKKRYIANIELSRHVDIETKGNDYILHYAKEMIDKGKLKGVSQKIIDNLLTKYKENKNDLTVITSYLTNNYELLIKQEEVIERTMPELNSKQVKFINKSTLNHYYNIKDYQNINKTSYETARTSLEKMTKLKFYKKEKIGKKFVYKAILKFERGGKYGN